MLFPTIGGIQMNFGFKKITINKEGILLQIKLKTIMEGTSNKATVYYHVCISDKKSNNN